MDFTLWYQFVDLWYSLSFLAPYVVPVLITVLAKFFIMLDQRLSNRETSRQLKWGITFALCVVVAIVMKGKEITGETLTVYGFIAYLGYVMGIASGVYNTLFKGSLIDTGMESLMTKPTVVELPARAIEGQE